MLWRGEYGLRKPNPRRFTDADLTKLEKSVERIERALCDLRHELEAANLRCTEARSYDKSVESVALSPRWNTWLNQVQYLLYKERCAQQQEATA
jgi:hypothetical protein